ncbi:unnamed protein product [Schistosoma mattheei]|uniref:Uncharacterized protein n=1 Tax=Schistosoma mattheei TaxID=31246 RepID=A0A183PSK2_9TREM|nr:unnamed protein product [Schistosoma mattheei]
MLCCTTKKLLKQEAMGILSLAGEKNDDSCADNTSTDSEECVSVVLGVTRRLKHPIVTDGKVNSTLTLMRSELPLDTDIGNHVPLLELEDQDKTVTVSNSPGVLSDKNGPQYGEHSWKKRYQKQILHCVSRQMSLSGQSFFIS